MAEVIELEAETEEEYQRKWAEYKKQLEEWKLWRRKQVHFINTYSLQLKNYINQIMQQNNECFNGLQRGKKKKTKKKKTVVNTDDEDDENASESEGPAEEGPPKPEPPEKPDFDSLEQIVREKASRIRRKPGEPILIPELSASGNITATEQCPRYDPKKNQLLLLQ